MTAVEYIREKLLGDEYWYENMTFEQIFEQAKEIEKQHLCDFYVQGGMDAIIKADSNAEQYYNETFKSE
jgi:hypothetical protein